MHIVGVVRQRGIHSAVVKAGAAQLADHDVNLRTTAQPGDLQGEPVGRVEVVGVQEGDVIAAGVCQTEVSRRGRSAILLTDDLDGVAEPPDDGGTPVGRSVVDDHDLEEFPAPDQDTFDGLADDTARY